MVTQPTLELFRRKYVHRQSHIDKWLICMKETGFLNHSSNFVFSFQNKKLKNEWKEKNWREHYRQLLKGFLQNGVEKLGGNWRGK